MIRTASKEHQGLGPHLWILLCAVVALAALYLGEMGIARWSSAGAASRLEPVFSLPGGYYERDIRLEIEGPSNGLGKQTGVIFTVDGSVPTHTVGTVYTQPIHLSAATPSVTVVRARAVLPSGELGPVASASYFVGVQATLPLLSLIVDPGDLWDPEYGIDANPLERGQAWERPVEITYVDEDRRAGFHILAGIRVHGGGARGNEKKSFRLYFRQEYGVARLEYPLFADSNVRSFKRLVLHTSGQDWNYYPHRNWTLMRSQLTDRLVFELGGYSAHSRPALVFINGEPWGIYNIRERMDRHFLADHYGIEATDLLSGPEFPGEGTFVVMGDRKNWDHLMQFVETHDLAVPANYAYVQSQVDIANFIDYNLLQIYAANTDWPHHNVQQFRPRVQGGRWRWMFWDSDYSFGATLLSRADTDMIDWVLNHDHPQTGGRDLLLLRKLLENPAFLGQFLRRTADLLNTTLAPPSVIAHVDALAAGLAPDMAYETTRWSSLADIDTVATGLGLDVAEETAHWLSPAKWASSVEELRDFARSRPGFVRQHVVERFGLGGTAQLTFSPPIAGQGTIAVNGALVPDLPWQGVYFQGVSIHITAVPAPGYRFAGWESPDLAQGPEIALTVYAAQTVAPRFEAVDDNAPRPGDVVFAGYSMDQGSHLGEIWFELLVVRPGGVDLRGWRVTDNDTKTATDEGSLVFTDDAAFARVPRSTTIRVILSSSRAGRVEEGSQDDLSTWDRQMVLYVGNGHLDTGVDPGFNLGPSDNLMLLAPGPTEAFDDDQGVALVARGGAVTPASCGILTDGVLADGGLPAQ